MESFSEWLEVELQKRGWSPADLAREMGTYVGTVTRVLHGKRNPGPDFCRALARALNYPQEFVFRKAGLLDDTLQKEDILTRLLNHFFAQLSPQEQQIILAQIEALARSSGRKGAR